MPRVRTAGFSGFGDLGAGTADPAGFASEPADLAGFASEPADLAGFASEPAVDADRCLRLYRQLTAGVSIVSVAGPDRPHGMTASAVTSVSLRPPLLSVALKSGSETLSWIQSSRAFGVQLLCADQRDLARSFAVPGGPRFQGVAHRDVLGVPLLTDCLAWSVCLVTDCRPYGDHHVVIGQVVATHVTGGPPLVWHDQEFAELATGPASPAIAPPDVARRAAA